MKWNISQHFSSPFFADLFNVPDFRKNGNKWVFFHYEAANSERRFFKINLLIKYRFDFELVLKFWKVCQEPEGINTKAASWFYPVKKK